MTQTLDGIVSGMAEVKRINNRIGAEHVRPFINSEIISNLDIPESEREAAVLRVENIVGLCPEQAFNLLMILRYASERGKFVGTAKKIEDFYEGITKRRSESHEKTLDVSKIIAQRKLPYEIEVNNYLEGLYRELGVSPAEL